MILNVKFLSIINYKTNIDKLKAMKININGFEYTKKEVLEALKRKGYLILKHTFPQQNEDIQAQMICTECALKGQDLPSESTQWHYVASREFQKQIVRPPLV